MDHLAMDAAAARAAGLTYGKYKGRQYEAEQTVKAKEEKVRQELRAKRLAEKAALERLQKIGKKITCVWCGREFWGIPPRKTCSPECQEERTRERNRTAYYRYKGVPVPQDLQFEIEQMRKHAAERRKEQEDEA